MSDGDNVIPFPLPVLTTEEHARRLAAKIEQLPPDKQAIVEAAMDLVLLLGDLPSDEKVEVLELLRRIGSISGEQRERLFSVLVDAFKTN